jgi:hypothetical protein
LLRSVAREGERAVGVERAEAVRQIAWKLRAASVAIWG